MNPEITQLLFAIEDKFAVRKTLVVGDAILARTPTAKINKTMIPRRASTTTLSKDKDNVGQGSTDFSFDLDVRGSGTLGVAPEIAKVLRCCGMRLHDPASFIHMQLLDSSMTQAIPAGTWIEAQGNPAKFARTVVYHPQAPPGAPQVPLFCDTISSGAGAWAGGENVVLRSNPGGPVIAVMDAAELGVGLGILLTPESVIASKITTTGTISGTFVPGEVVTNGGGSPDPTDGFGILREVLSGFLRVEFIRGVAGFAAGNTITGLQSGATVALHGSNINETTDRMPSATIRRYGDGDYDEGIGCRGDWSLNWQAGNDALLSFAFQGQTIDHDTALALPGASYPSTNVLQFASAWLAFDGLAFPVSSFALGINNTRTLRPDATAAFGRAGVQITGREPSYTIDPELVVPGIYDWRQKWADATTVEFFCSMGDTPGNRVALLMRKSQVQDLAFGSRDGLVSANLTMAPRLVFSGDDEIEWYFL